MPEEPTEPALADDQPAESASEQSASAQAASAQSASAQAASERAAHEQAPSERAASEVPVSGEAANATSAGDRASAAEGLPSGSRVTTPDTDITDRPDAEKRERELVAQLQSAVYHFHGDVGAKAFHTGFGGQHKATARRATGRLHDDDIDDAVRGYVEPSGFDAALTSLTRDHVVVLDGEVGTGRRSGAIKLLREVTEKSLIALSPQTTVDELADRKYETGYGYIVTADARIAGGYGEAEFTWLTVRNQVREVRAYLVVITSAGATTSDSLAVQHVPWTRPDIVQALRNKLGDTDPAVLESLATRLPATCSMTDIASVARRIAGGADPDAALVEFDAASAGRVREWLDQVDSRAEVLSITTLAFAEGIGLRGFEQLRGALRDRMAEHLPPPKPKREKTKSDVLPDNRQSTISGLMRLERRVEGDVSRQALVFDRPGYRRDVLVELSNRYEIPFWDAVREWIQGVIITQPNLQMAQGLALLASVDFREVDDGFLEHWSNGMAGPGGQVMAAYVLWYLCLDESMAPIALNRATRWATHGAPHQRWTAAMTFGGVLGVCYPTDAIRRLWHLITQSGAGMLDACLALAQLFATLNDGTEDAGRVLTMLHERLEAVDQPRLDRGRLLKVTALTILAVVSVRDPRADQRSIMLYTHRNPDRIDVVARLWAAVLCYRPYRRRALIAFWQGLSRLRQLGGDPIAHVRVLGEALARALPDSEHADFVNDFAFIDERMRRGKEPSESLAAVLIAALNRFRTVLD